LPIAITESEKTVPTPTQPLQINCNNGVVKVTTNLFDAESDWNINSSCNPNTTPATFPNTTSGNRYTFFFKCKPNTSYTISWKTAGDRLFIGGLNTVVNPTEYTTPFSLEFDRNIYFISSSIPLSYTFTTNSTEKMIGIWYSLYTLPTDIVIRETIPSIYTDGTTEKVEIAGNNLLDTASIVTGYRLNVALNVTYGGTSGNLTDFVADTSYYVSNLIPVEVGKTYIKNSPSADAYHRFKVYNANKVAVRISSANSITIQSDEAYIAFCGMQTELTTAYCGELLGTATAENLFKVDDYQDVQSVIDGGVTRKVGIKVLDGTESWTASTFTAGKFFISTAVADWGALQRAATGYCTHAVFNSGGSSGNGRVNFDLNSFCFYYSTSSTTLTAFKQFLADQYANGTPVIVVYPTSSATTETVTAQPMNIQAGTNIVQITQASMDNLELEVKYKAGVEVTITEVQNAQLDNNVEVTIQ
jgi:hypothetical protein